MKISTKKQLAMMYCPTVSYRTAIRTLNRWIDSNANLKSALARNGYIATQRSLTPEQVRLIPSCFGQP